MAACLPVWSSFLGKGLYELLVLVGRDVVPREEVQQHLHLYHRVLTARVNQSQVWNINRVSGGQKGSKGVQGGQGV